MQSDLRSTVVKQGEITMNFEFILVYSVMILLFLVNLVLYFNLKRKTFLYIARINDRMVTIAGIFRTITGIKSND
jgi:hypothetical protein